MVQIAGHGATTAAPDKTRSEIILFILQYQLYMFITMSFLSFVSIKSWDVV